MLSRLPACQCVGHTPPVAALARCLDPAPDPEIRRSAAASERTRPREVGEGGMRKGSFLAWQDVVGEPHALAAAARGLGEPGEEVLCWVVQPGHGAEEEQSSENRQWQAGS